MKARFILFTLVFGLSTTQASFANSLSEAKDYCESLDVAGLAQEEASQVINDCIEEQSQYISEQESDFEQEPQDIDCYQEAESAEQENENGESNYDELLQACFDRLA